MVLIPGPHEDLAERGPQEGTIGVPLQSQHLGPWPVQSLLLLCNSSRSALYFWFQGPKDGCSPGLELFPPLVDGARALLRGQQTAEMAGILV